MKSVVKNKKTATKKAAPAKTVSKSTAKTTPKKAVKASPKVSVKTTAKSAKPAAKKAVKVAAVKKAAPKAVAKPVAKKTVVAKPVAKPAAKHVKEAKPIAVKKVEAKAPAIKAVTKATAQPVIVKMANNQNIPVKSPMIATIRPQPTASQKDAAAQAAAARPVYRPIQVINKSLAPIQPVRQMAPVSKADEKVEFKKGDYVVYPAHGVGEIEAVETQTIGGMEIKLYAIVFEKDRMRLKVPVFKAHASGLRRLSSANRMQDALKTLQGRAQIRRAMWSRRAQEYETKINSGDPVSIAEVLRDLKRSNDDTEQSYSERQIYQSALERLAREVAALDKITEIEAAERLENMIKGRRARAAAAKASEEAVA